MLRRFAPADRVRHLPVVKRVSNMRLIAEAAECLPFALTNERTATFHKATAGCEVLFRRRLGSNLMPAPACRQALANFRRAVVEMEASPRYRSSAPASLLAS